MCTAADRNRLVDAAELVSLENWSASAVSHADVWRLNWISSAVGVWP